MSIIPAARRAGAFIRWLKKNPILTAIGIAASVLGFIKGIPPAWEAIMEMSGRPKCYSYSDKYDYASGSYRRNGGEWIENDGTNNYKFVEARRDESYIYLKNVTPRVGDRRTMLVRLPVCGGAAQWTYQNPMQWTDMYPVWK